MALLGGAGAREQEGWFKERCLEDGGVVDESRVSLMPDQEEGEEYEEETERPEVC